LRGALEGLGSVAAEGERLADHGWRPGVSGASGRDRHAVGGGNQPPEQVVNRGVRISCAQFLQIY